VTAGLLVVALTAGACATQDAANGPASGTPTPSAADVAPPLPGELVLVLPALDRLDPLELARIRAGASRALDEVLGVARPFRLVAAPTSASLGDVVEQAVRGADIVCVLGPDARAALEAALTLYPRTVGCGLPAPADGAVLEGIDPDLEDLGRRLGRAARAAAGDRDVLVLAGGDALHGVGWVAGVSDGAGGGPVRVLGSADAVREELARDGSGPPVLDDAGIDRAIARGPVGVVVLDASPGAAELALELLEGGVLLIAPRAFVVDAPDGSTVVLRWRVRWEVPLVGLLRRAVAVADGTVGAVPPPRPTTEGMFDLEEGPAHVRPDSQPLR
jgi:hypothetical protein